ncbi:acyl CoA:acetate/3-ketoacid CoA transferase [bacterium]|nr:acyl CoA:acetate/3-ketoacid CoA transferase [bacterium]
MKVITAQESAALIQSGWTVAMEGFLGAGAADDLAKAAETRFLATGEPRDLTMLFCAATGDREFRGLNRFGHLGMTKRAIGSHFGPIPKMRELIDSNQIEAHNWPQGVISHLYRAIAAKRPGMITPVGLHTFVDPRYEGGRMTTITKESLIEVITLKGKEYLFYPSFPINCALIRGTTADENGNITTEHEAIHLDHLAMAQAAHNSGGIVIVQVKYLTKTGTMNPNLVRIPGILVDYVVVADPKDHWMTYAEEYNPAYTGETHEPDHAFTPDPLDVRKVVSRRAFMELLKLERPVVNLGVGMPTGVGSVAREEGKTDFTFTVEAGPIGGTPAHVGLSFGAAVNPEAIIDQAAQFDFYDGGGLDITFLGMAELDGQGNVNASRIHGKGARRPGVGGFINISQATKRVIFTGTYTAGGLEIATGDGRLRIVKEGRSKKVVSKLLQMTFNGPYVAAKGAEILYVTERAVFTIRDNKLTLIEIAPGIDLQQDVLDQAETAIVVAPDLKTMDARIFFDKPMLR